MSSLRFIGRIVALVLGGLLFAIEMWTVVPAPTILTLALSVIASETAPWGIAVGLILGAIVQVMARGWARTLATVFIALSIGCALVPFALLRGTLRQNEREMRAALGPTYARAVSDRERAPLAQRPYSLVTSFLGFARSNGVRVNRDLPVIAADGTPLALDLYRPAKHGPHPTVIIIYGGAWMFGSRADSAEMARAFAAIGDTAIAIDYRHAPRFHAPTQINDVRAAIATIARNARAWEVDPQRVAILGRSAGAELALLAAYMPEPLTVKAAVGYYAPVDLVQGWNLPPVPDPANVRRILLAYIGAPPDLRMSEYIAASPFAHVAPHLPPTFLICGGRDEIVRLSFQHEMRDALRLHGDRVAALDLPWANHAFDSIPNGIGGQIARYYTERFLAASL